MAKQLHLELTVVVPDDQDDYRVLAALPGRTLPDIPGSWIARVRAVLPQRSPGDWDDVLEAELDADAGLGD